MGRIMRVVAAVAVAVATGCVPPTEPPAPLTVTQLAAGGGDHTCALLADQTVVCWGDNTWGQLGNGQTGDSAKPVPVQGLTNAVSVAAGADHSCAALADHTVRCWGRNDHGQLGSGGVDLAPHPTPGPTLALTITQMTSGGLFTWQPSNVVAGGLGTCATGGSFSFVQCWGYGNASPQALGSVPHGSTAVTYEPTNIGFGRAHQCIGRNGATLGNPYGSWSCSGEDASGQATGVLPTSSVNMISRMIAGADSTCAKWSEWTTGPRQQCWGDNRYGQLGGGTSQPGPVVPVQFPAVVGTHSCSLDTAVRCWGLNDHGQLGNGTTTNSLDAVEVPATTGATQVVRGDRHTCARMSGGSVQCWGRNQHGQLGNGYTLDAFGPVVVVAS